MSKKSKIFGAASVVLAAAVTCSCAGGKGSSVNNMDLSSYPVKADEELTCWFELGTNISTSVSNFGETDFAKELEKRTGVKVKYIHPAQGQGNEAFGIMVASDDMADIIRFNWSTALGGPSATVKDNVIISLNDYLDEYAPNYKALVESDEDINKRVKNDDGDYFTFAPISTDPIVSAGPMIRKDWLDDLGLEVPKTVDELENALRMFKEKKGAEAAFSGTSSLTVYLLNILGTTETFYVDNGKIKYAPAEPEYKRALERLSKWYREGLLDQNYLSNDDTMLNANILNGDTGFVMASIGSGMGKWMTAMKGKDDKFELVAMPYVTYEGETKPNWIVTPSKVNQWSMMAISGKCRYPELAVKFLDYGYSEEGHMLFNFGVEGKTYEMKDGYPTYTDEILNNPNGLTINQAMGLNFAASGGSISAYESDRRYIEQYYQLQNQKDAYKIWISQMDDELKNKTLPLLYYSYEESEEYTEIVTNLNKYRQETTAEFISGTKPISEFDSYVEGLKSLKLDRVLEIVQGSYDRYQKK